MRLQTLARLSLAAAVALLLSGPVALAGDTQATDGDSTAVPSAEQDGDDRNRTQDGDILERDDGTTPPRVEMPEEGGRHDRPDRRMAERPERPERVDRVGSDVPRPDFRPERAERPPGISGVRPNG